MPEHEPTAVDYRGFQIEYDPPPVPDRRHDWRWSHPGVDGAPDSGDGRIGTAPTLIDAKLAVDDYLDEHPDGVTSRPDDEYQGVLL